LVENRDFFIPPLYSTPPLAGFPLEYCHAVWYGKTRMAWLPEGEKILKICLLVLAQLTNVTDRRTDRQTDGRTDKRNVSTSKCLVWEFYDSIHYIFQQAPRRNDGREMYLIDIQTYIQ